MQSDAFSGLAKTQCELCVLGRMHGGGSRGDGIRRVRHPFMHGFISDLLRKGTRQNHQPEQREEFDLICQGFPSSIREYQGGTAIRFP